MNSEIISDILTLKTPTLLTTESVENILIENFGDNIIRWAIIQADNDYIKISVTYKKGT